MGQKFAKARVLERLNAARTRAGHGEGAARLAYSKAMKRYPTDQDKWRKSMTAWCARSIRLNRDPTQYRGIDRPSPCVPREPEKPNRHESERILALIRQVECAVGPDIYLTSGVFHNLARYL